MTLWPWIAIIATNFIENITTNEGYRPTHKDRRVPGPYLASNVLKAWDYLTGLPRSLGTLVVILMKFVVLQRCVEVETP